MDKFGRNVFWDYFESHFSGSLLVKGKNSLSKIKFLQKRYKVNKQKIFIFVQKLGH